MKKAMTILGMVMITLSVFACGFMVANNFAKETSNSVAISEIRDGQYQDALENYIASTGKDVDNIESSITMNSDEQAWVDYCGYSDDSIVACGGISYAYLMQNWG